MKIEELKQIIFLLEHGYYDDEVMKMANKDSNYPTDYYELRGDEIVVWHDGICGYYNQDIIAPNFGRNLLKRFRTDYIKNKYPKVSKLLNIEEDE